MLPINPLTRNRIPNNETLSSVKWYGATTKLNIPPKEIAMLLINMNIKVIRTKFLFFSKVIISFLISIGIFFMFAEILFVFNFKKYYDGGCGGFSLANTISGKTMAVTIIFYTSKYL